MQSRPDYLRKIKPFIDKPVVKVLTGMRRVGKSCLLELLQAELLASGIDEKRIVFLNLESMENAAIRTDVDLYETIRKRIGRKPTFLFLDEIQEVAGWEKVVNSLLTDKKADIYITGSNARLLSSELATYIAGRYVEVPVFPLSFQEHLDFRGEKCGSREEEFARYLKYGGLPGLHAFEWNDEIIYQYISGIYDSVLLKDVIARNSIRDISLLESVGRFVLDNIGNVVSANRIAQFLKNQQRKAGSETIYNYLRALEQGFLVYRVPRYDLKGKRYLEIHEKYFLGDIGLRHAQLGFKEGDISGLLENLVYLELRRRGYRVSIGKWQELEIDFVAERENEKQYIQVAYLLAGEETVRREFEPLQKIRDNYAKRVLSLDSVWGTDCEGIQRLNLIDFLLEKHQKSQE
ncbi:MAG: ATP-binding protein [Planctomycetaceae bacterium]|nr:ATP-binding protein [Planctomycetaceae bacterium]